MTFPLILKLIHELLGIALIAGIVGRTVLLRRMRQLDRIDLMVEEARLAGTFDVIVVQASRLVLIFGLMTAWFQGWPILGFLVGGTSNWVLAALVLFGVIIVLVPTVFLPSGRRFAAALADATAAGKVTDELRAALNDRRLEMAHRLEAVLLFLIVVLMVLKPF